MRIFNKKSKKTSLTTEEKTLHTPSTKKRNPVPHKEQTRKLKIGFGLAKKRERTEQEITPIKEGERRKKPAAARVKKHPLHKEKGEKHVAYEEIDVKHEDIAPAELEPPIIPREKEDSVSKKRKAFLQKDMIGKPVYLEDTGEKLGRVFDMTYDEKKKLVGYKIKDDKSDTVLSFSVDQFDEDKNGLIFIPSWYNKSVKTIEKLEFKDRIAPEITTLLVDDTISNEELYDIFLKHDDEMADYMEEATALRGMLNNRLKILEKQRLALKEDLMDLTEKRLIKDIDRKRFSENVMEHRRRVNILDVNIKKCRELMQRLDRTSFGMLRKHTVAKSEIETTAQDRKTYENLKEKNKLRYADEIENPYEQRYHNLKERYEQLEEDYNELKIAVEKLFNKHENLEEP